MYNNIGRRPLFNPSREYYFRHETELVTTTLISYYFTFLSPLPSSCIHPLSLLFTIEFIMRLSSSLGLALASLIIVVTQAHDHCEPKCGDEEGNTVMCRNFCARSSNEVTTFS